MQTVTHEPCPDASRPMARKAICSLLIVINLGIGSLGSHVGEVVLGMLHAGEVPQPVNEQGCGVQGVADDTQLTAHVARSRAPARER